MITMQIQNLVVTGDLKLKKDNSKAVTFSVHQIEFPAELVAHMKPGESMLNSLNLKSKSSSFILSFD